MPCVDFPHIQACEAGKLAIAELLVAEFPDTLSMRDKHNRLPQDVVPNWSHQWAQLLGDRNNDLTDDLTPR